MSKYGSKASLIKRTKHSETILFLFCLSFLEAPHDACEAGARHGGLFRRRNGRVFLLKLLPLEFERFRTEGILARLLLGKGLLLLLRRSPFL
jgi:hypothetical protein